MRTLNPELSWLLDQTIASKASDLHLVAECSPSIRIDGQLRALDKPAYTADQVTTLITEFIGSALSEKIASTRKELDFSFSYSDHRFRVNIFYAKGVLAASLRVLANQVLSTEDLGVAPILLQMIERRQGLIIVAGPTGHGKSTTLAALVNHITE
jgi:twitching motility protein PilT